METTDRSELSQAEPGQHTDAHQEIRALLLPIKDLRNAKRRLAGVLTPEERFGLAQAMLQDTILAVSRVGRAEKIFVITNYEPAIEAAAKYSWEILREEHQVSESASVDFASHLCGERGVTALLRLPLDLPLIQPCDIDELLAIECSAPATVIVPSRDGTGTNAILRTPPTLFPSHFGPNSFAKHCSEAERASRKTHRAAKRAAGDGRRRRIRLARASASRFNTYIDRKVAGRKRRRRALQESRSRSVNTEPIIQVVFSKFGESADN